MVSYSKIHNYSTKNLSLNNNYTLKFWDLIQATHSIKNGFRTELV